MDIVAREKREEEEEKTRNADEEKQNSRKTLTLQRVRVKPVDKSLFSAPITFLLRLSHAPVGDTPICPVVRRAVIE